MPSQGPAPRLPDFLAALPIPDKTKWDLANLAAASPAVLLGMINAVPEALRSLLGPYFSVVRERLEAMVGGIPAPPLPTGCVPPTGAVLGSRPKDRPTWTAALRERDALFDTYNRAQKGQFPLPARLVEKQLDVLLQPLAPTESSWWAQGFEWLLPYIPVSPWRCAPERAEEVDDIVRRTHLHFRWGGDHPHALLLRPVHREVEIGPWLVLRLWPWCCAAAEVMHAGEDAPLIPVSAERDSIQHELDWEHQISNIAASGQKIPLTIDFRYPGDLPVPRADAARDSSEELAIEFCVHAAAAVLLHAIGHFAWGHPIDLTSQPEPACLLQEYDANKFASNILIGKWQSYALAESDFKPVIRRGIGLVLMALLGGGVETFEGPPGAPRWHPAPEEALLRELTAFKQATSEDPTTIRLVARVACRLAWEKTRRSRSVQYANTIAQNICKEFYL